MGIVEKAVNTLVNNHHIMVEISLCSRFRTPKSDCSLCADVCPANAIEISDRGAEIKEGCIDCGVCYSACPSGALRIKGRDDHKIIGEIKDTLKRKLEDEKIKRDEERNFTISQPLNFSISCNHGVAKADLVLSCLSRLTEVLLLEPVRIGISGIEILRPSCDDCPSAKASPQLEKVIQQTRYLYELIGLRNVLHVTRCAFSPLRPGTQILASAGTEPKILSRRELFKSLGVKAAGIAADSIPAIEQKDKGNGEVFREAIQNRPENLKRTLLSESIKGFVSENPPSPPFSKGGKGGFEVPSKEALLAELEVTSGCTGCGVCATLCPTGAIIQKITEDRFYLYFRPDLCTNCEVCVKTCMPHAVNIKEKVLLNLILEQGERRIFEAGKKKCLVCRLDFIGSSDNICPLCINNHKKQMATIQSLIK